MKDPLYFVFHFLLGGFRDGYIGLDKQNFLA